MIVPTKNSTQKSTERKEKMRNIKFTRLMALVLALIMSLSLFACGNTDKPADEGNKPAGEQAGTNAPAGNDEPVLAEEQVLNLRLSDLSLIDVNDVRNSNEFLVLTQVQEGLFRIFTDENGNETEFEYLDVIEYQGSEYLILMPLEDESGEIVILLIEPVDEETENYLAVEDEATLEAVFQLFKERYKDILTFEE